LEKAKLFWNKNDKNGAFKVLELGLKEVLGSSENPDLLSQDDKVIYSKGKMMIARYQAEAVNLEFHNNLKLFKEAKVEGVQNEKLFLVTADFMDRYYSEKENGSLHDKSSVMRAYLNSMVCGSDHVFQSMPRFLTIWLDSTADYNKASKHEFSSMNKLAEKAAERLPPYMFYTALSQIIARICHPSPDTFAVLKQIIVKLICEHPQQTLWYLIPMLKSTNSTRAGKCKEILNGDRLKGSQMQNLIRDFNSLIDKFIKLSSHSIRGNERVLSVKAILPDLINFLKTKPSQIIIPFQSNLQLIRVRKPNSFKFSDGIVKIHSVQDKVDVMASLQKPRKVTLLGDDGKEYPALFKPNDDCRIDQRFMEFSSVLKEFLHKDPESRRRQLTTRTYCVIPLNENAGFIGKLIELIFGLF
jgi:serine/threonine-protein kinase ATR